MLQFTLFFLSPCSFEYVLIFLCTVLLENGEVYLEHLVKSTYFGLHPLHECFKLDYGNCFL